MKEQKPAIRIDKMHLLDNAGSTKAFCSLVLFDAFVIKGLRIVDGENGIFLSMPQEKSKDGKWYDTFHPLSGEMRKGLNALVVDHYKEQALQNA